MVVPTDIRKCEKPDMCSLCAYALTSGNELDSESSAQSGNITTRLTVIHGSYCFNHGGIFLRSAMISLTMLQSATCLSSESLVG